MSTTTNLNTLKINYLTQDQFNTALANGEIEENELYLTADDRNIIVSPNDPSAANTYPQNSIWLKYGDISGGQQDWIIDQGESGIWSWRKWYSGKSECWGTIQTESFDMTTAWGSLFYGTLSTPNYPAGIFVATPTVSVTMSCTNGNAWATHRLQTSTATTPGTVYAISPVSATLEIKTNISAQGRWM